MSGKRVIHAVALSCAAIALAGCSRREPPGPRPASKIPYYADFQVIRVTPTSRRSSDFFTHYIRSKARFEDVKEFYLRTLGPLGWRLKSEAPVTDDGYGAGARKIEMEREYEWISVIYAGENSRFEVTQGNYTLFHSVRRSS